MMMKQANSLQDHPGAAPGIEHDEIVGLSGGNETVRITCIDYNPGNVLIQEIEDLDDFLGHHRPEWSNVRWISVEGFSNLEAVHALATKYDLHPLAVEDLLHARQRPKVEAYGGEESEFQARLFIVTQVPKIEEKILHHEQLSIFVGHNTVLTFQQTRSEVWEPVYQRIKTKGSRLRSNDTSFLAYSLLDTVVDRCFPILETYSDLAEELEALVLERTQPDLINQIHQLKRDLLSLHRVLWPMREVVAALQRDPHECLSDTTRVYLRDLYDHVIQIIEIIETYREMVSDLTETYMSSISNRMNEIMKVLTLIGTIFIPLTFLAGVYGMNFHYLPELSQVWAYPVFWVICFISAAVMLLLFRRRSWF